MQALCLGMIDAARTDTHHNPERSISLKPVQACFRVEHFGCWYEAWLAPGNTPHAGPCTLWGRMRSEAGPQGVAPNRTWACSEAHVNHPQESFGPIVRMPMLPPPKLQAEGESADNP